MVVDTNTVENAKWGVDCDAWALLRAPGLSVVQKRVPAGGSEVEHYHEYAHQFFFTLSGELTLEVAGARASVGPGQGMSVKPRVPHRLFNLGESPVTYLLISSPNSKGDRVTTAQGG